MPPIASSNRNESTVFMIHQMPMAKSKNTGSNGKSFKTAAILPGGLPGILIQDHDGTVRPKKWEDDFQNCQGMVFVGITGPDKSPIADSKKPQGRRKRSSKSDQSSGKAT